MPPATVCSALLDPFLRILKGWRGSFLWRGPLYAVAGIFLMVWLVLGLIIFGLVTVLEEGFTLRLPEVDDSKALEVARRTGRMPWQRNF